MNKAGIFKALHPALILLFGLAMAQGIATIQVYLSNHDLSATLTSVAAAGYLAIPNRYVWASLLEIRTAFWGGLFFAFTIGAGITLAAMAASWIWVRSFRRKKWFLVFSASVWAGLMLLVNRNGLSVMPTLYFLLIAPAVFALTAVRESGTDEASGGTRPWAHLIPVPLLALLWFTQFDAALFIDLRDNLLLSNHYGRKFSDFYYRYTLYPAQAFKGLNQKTIKTGRIEHIRPRVLNQRIGRQLLANDYLPLNGAAAVDLTVLGSQKDLIFIVDGRPVFQIPIHQFLKDSAGALGSVAAKADRHAAFRQITFLSLLLGFPVALYMIVHAAVYYLGYFIIGRKASAWTASIVCLAAGIVVLIYFQSNRSRGIGIEDISASLSSSRWQTRTAALKLIAQKKLDLSAYAAYPLLPKKNLPPAERYWLARTLAFSRRPETIRILLDFLSDENLNVRTMAFYSLGLRRDPKAIRPILKKIETSENWYDQMYAYRALRSLGWNQNRSR